MNKTLTWNFPLPRTHTGILMGNAVTGLMIWGGGSQLNITIGRSDLWDHRGGMCWSDKHIYKDIRNKLEANDEVGLKAMFKTDTEDVPGQPMRPSIISIGRIELDLGTGTNLIDAILKMDEGIVEINYTRNHTNYTLSIALEMNSQLAAIISNEPDINHQCHIKHRPFFELSNELQEISFKKPIYYNLNNISGWYQPFPVDDGISVLVKETPGTLFIANDRSQEKALDLISKNITWENIITTTQKWWGDYFLSIPDIITPDPDINSLYTYGMYKFAGFSQPNGIPGGLQGPWIEDYALPPWSADYHFNINAQMCYCPAYKSGKYQHLMPLFDLIFSWHDTLKDNAKKFIGIDDGILLPHAVDDRGTCMGGFWTGCIDHACTAWIADMMWNYVDFSGDIEFLATKALPFMSGAMRVYEEMLEFNGDSYSLPVSVSPEYRGSEMNAWGKNASFQLAAIHRLIEDIEQAHLMLDREVPESLLHIAKYLPKATLVKEGSILSTYKSSRIALWQDTDLEESHRHHSHLAAICPFDIINWEDQQWSEIISNTIDHWIGKGMGMWSGWCMPWASMIHTRLGNGDGAKLMLDIWKRVFTNEGYGTLHDCNMIGLTLMGSRQINNKDVAYRNEVMQLDAGFGAVTAIQDMMLHSRRGVLYVFQGIPHNWKNCSFTSMPCGGGFSVSATKKNGVITEITIYASRNGKCKIANPTTGIIETKKMKMGEYFNLI
ncbi:MAG: hypothetical protein U9O87_07890 [Verrucomicrobiota bacterium]|nr:hypothetical protein [Verrucomicrobiota bacterium]